MNTWQLTMTEYKRRKIKHILPVALTQFKSHEEEEGFEIFEGSQADNAVIIDVISGCGEKIEFVN